jgi:hypothetical protein
MTRFISLLALVLATALPCAAQQPALAGATRPNLQVLEDLPEAQLFPLMNLIAQSLGVRCDYCHVQVAPDLTRTPSNVGGWVWDRDDKQPKRTAREMMRMVVDLNAGRFQGQARITCYTCHRGSVQPARTPPLPPPPGSAGSTTNPTRLPLPSADRLWTTYVNAVGQVGSPTRATGTVFSGWDDRSEGRYGKVEIVVAGSDRYRATVSTADGITRQALDGEIAWIAARDQVVRLSAADAARLRRTAMRYWPVKERPANLQVIGVERIGERDAYVATARISPIMTWTLYFDVVTGLLRRELTTTETMLVPLLEQVDYDDYRDVGGIQLPFQMRTSDGAPYSTVTRTFLQIRRNVAVEDSLFRLPETRR